jgi:hypothetical protein
MIDNKLERPLILTAIKPDGSIHCYQCVNQHEILKFKLVCEQANLQYTIVELPENKSDKKLEVNPRWSKIEKANKARAKQLMLDANAIKPMIDNY